MNEQLTERFTQIEENLNSSLEAISTALLNKKVDPGELKVSEIADKIREIEILTEEPIKTGIIGVKITEDEPDPANRVVYTDQAIDHTPVTMDLETGVPNYALWNQSWIFDKIYPAMVNTDGTIAYKLDTEDQTQKAEGGESDINNFDFDGNAMVVVEKFYTKLSIDGEDECIQISDTKQSGFEAIGFIREDGSEADYICLPMFMGKISNGKLRSISGRQATLNETFTDFRTAAQKNGSTYDIETYVMNQLLEALYLILFKTCDHINTLGAGRGRLHDTGVLASKGAIAYDPSSQAVKFLWVEDFVSNPNGSPTYPFYKYEAGLLLQNGKLYVKMKPPYSGSSTSGYAEVPDYVSAGGWLSKMKCSNQYGRYAVACDGSNATYDCSLWAGNDNTGYLRVSYRGDNTGIAGRILIWSASYKDTNASFGAALTLIPPK